MHERRPRVANDDQQLDNVAIPEDNAAVAVAGRQRGTYMGFARTLATIFSA